MVAHGTTRRTGSIKSGTLPATTMASVTPRVKTASNGAAQTSTWCQERIGCWRRYPVISAMEPRFGSTMTPKIRISAQDAYFRRGSGDWPRPKIIPGSLPQPPTLVRLYTSGDGIHWSAPTRAGDCGDNSGIFYNPFRKMWTYSIRTRWTAAPGAIGSILASFERSMGRKRCPLLDRGG
jgi:hypothetical protein